MAQQELNCGCAIMKWLQSGRLARRIFAAAAILSGLALTPARADVLVRIDKSSQRMAVSVDGAMRYNWPVSTGRGGYGTPSGTFHPQRMARHYFSRKYYNSPMPHAIFFRHGFAIHGTYDISRLGGPASHGCVRLHPSHAAALFALVERNGPRNTRIKISN
jgi:lipoprotein-anchoring transpeptidase ErfK/SrfK